MQSEVRHTISEVSQKTGVAAVTLRAWERRYGLVKPQRTEKGHRLYTLENITEIEQIVSWLNRGVAIRNIPALLTQDHAPNVNDETIDEEWLSKQNGIFDAISNLDLRYANQLCDRINKSMPFNSLCEWLYQPVLLSLHRRWQKSPLGYKLEQQLWLQLWQRQTTLMTLRAEKQKPLARAWLVNHGAADSADDYWLLYGSLIQAGVRVNTINAYTELNGLSRLNDTEVAPLIIFGHQRLTVQEHNQLIKLNAVWKNELICLGGMVDIEPQFFQENSFYASGGNANQSLESSGVIKWLIRGDNVK
jgi:DNA-binding transcriptional MerR regulator